jgi:hypothetical protein
MSIKNTVAAILSTACLSLIGAPADADLMPTTGLAHYSAYRQEILKLGWKPKTVMVPDYVEGWPEVICGNRLCSATFASENGKQILTLSIWPDVKPGRVEYYVAPRFDIEDSKTLKQGHKY